MGWRSILQVLTMIAFLCSSVHAFSTVKLPTAGTPNRGLVPTSMGCGNTAATMQGQRHVRRFEKYPTKNHQELFAATATSSLHSSSTGSNKDFSEDETRTKNFDSLVLRLVGITKQLYKRTKSPQRRNENTKQQGLVKGADDASKMNTEEELESELSHILVALESHCVPTSSIDGRRQNLELTLHSLSDIMTSIFHLIAMNHPSMIAMMQGEEKDTRQTSNPKGLQSPLSRQTNSDTRSLSDKSTFQLNKSFVLAVWKDLEQHQADQHLNPQRWLDLLKTINALDMAHMIEIEPLYCRICLRLTRGDSLARLHPNQLIQCLQLFTTTMDSNYDHHQPNNRIATVTDKEENHVPVTKSAASNTRSPSRRHFHPDYYLQSCERELLQAVARRLRKQQVRRKTNTRLIMNAVTASVNLLSSTTTPRQGTSESSDDENDSTTTVVTLSSKEKATIDWIGEIKKLAFTFMKERLDRLSSSIADDNGDDCPPKNADKPMNRTMTLEEIAILFHCAKRIDLEKDSTVAQQLCSALETKTIDNSQEFRRNSRLLFADTARIIGTLENWHHRADVSLEYLGYSLHLMYLEQQHDDRAMLPRPHHVSAIFRSLCLLYPNPSLEIRTPFRDLGDLLFCDKRFLPTLTSFYDVSNALWFAVTFGVSQSAAESLGEHVLVVTRRSMDHVSSLGYNGKPQHCSPRMACRILNSFTALAVRNKSLQSKEANSSWFRVQAQLYEMFELLGEQLLSTQLDPLDASNALTAYAKSGYTQDPGILDHLALTMVRRFQGASIRQIVHSLWACAKLSQVDCGDSVQGARAEESLWYQDGDSVSYLTYAFDMAMHLSHFASELSTKDVAQTIWALARLGISNEEILDPLLERTRELVVEFNAQEAVSCLWSLTKLKHDAYDVVFQVIRKLQNDQFIQTLGLKEATTILYSLGKLDIREEYAFETLSNLILQKVEGGSEASSPTAIAQILWSHRQVHLKPPQVILDAWASKNLGLVPISSSPMDDDSIFDGATI